MSDQPERLITGYVPVLALTYVSIVLWGLMAIASWFRFYQHGKKYMLTLCITLATMVMGCGIRVKMTSEPGSLGVYIGTTLFTLLSPCGFIATSYIILPRLATWLDAEDCLFLPSARIVRIFVWSDVITFLLQCGGSGMSAASGNMGKIGAYICLVGLVLQLISFSVFNCLLGVWAYRVRGRHPHKWSRHTTSSNRMVKLRFLEDWRAILNALIWSAVGILIRSVFRIVEYAEGYDGHLRTTEWYLYVFDSLPLFVGMLAWVVVWPPAILNHEVPFDRVGGVELMDGQKGGSASSGWTERV